MKSCTPEIEYGSSFDENYEALKLMVGGWPPHPPLDQSLYPFSYSIHFKILLLTHVTKILLLKFYVRMLKSKCMYTL